MQGITLYLNDLEQARKWATDEELGRFLRIALDAAETETIPTFDNKNDDMMFDGFKKCLEKGIARVKIKRENGSKGGAPLGNQNAKKNKEEVESKQIKPNTNFDKGEVDENNLQLFLGLLSERKPQKNQSLKTLLDLNSSISGFCETNRINQATREKAWEMYKKG
jgi:hypothetical protein